MRGCEFAVLVGAEEGCCAVAGGDGVGWGHGLVVGGLGEGSCTWWVIRFGVMVV